VPGDLLNDGMYRVLLLVVKDQGIVLYRHDDILIFNVADSVERRGEWHGKWTGAVRPMLEWETEYLGEHGV
jgi:lipopolysaccharide transport system ATP-binding protein